MRFLEVKLYDGTANHKLESVSIIIQLHDQARGIEGAISISKHITNAQGKNAAKEKGHGEKPNRLRPVSAPHSLVRLRPTDRLVLNALRARVPEGKQVTMPVRLQELIEECVISRRQAQICLKRLTEQGLIERLFEGMSLGSQQGYPYKIT